MNITTEFKPIFPNLYAKLVHHEKNVEIKLFPLDDQFRALSCFQQTNLCINLFKFDFTKKINNLYKV